MAKIVIGYETFSDFELEQNILGTLGAGTEICHEPKFSASDGWSAAYDADALMVTIQKVPAELIERLAKCKIICRVGVGLDAIDVAAATARKIWVANVPDYSIDE